MFHNGEQISNPQLIAEQFNAFFPGIGAQSHQTSGTIKSPDSYLPRRDNLVFNFLPINNKAVSDIISKLKPKDSTGFDNISTRMLKFLGNLLTPVLSLVINQSLLTGIFPAKLKIAKVIPIFKKDDNAIFGNYRPISLLPAISKVFEKVVFKQIYSYFQVNSLFFCSQYGFREGHSTELAAAELVDRIYDQLDNGNISLAIFLDLFKK